MPKATVDRQTEKFELKSLDGAFVELRRLSYGEILRRRGLMQALTGISSSEDARMELRFEEASQFSFERCVVDHNLEDEKGNKLDFRLSETLTRLDPRVAQEIEELIEKMNEPPTDEERQSFRGASENGDNP